MRDLLYDLNDVRRLFSRRDLERGREYQQDGCVTDLALTEGGRRLRAKVMGTASRPYRVDIQIAGRPGRVAVSGACSCPVGWHCKHVVAALLALLEQGPGGLGDGMLPDPLGGPVGDWLKDLVATAASEDAAGRDVALYILADGPNGAEVTIRAGRPKDGGFANERPYPVENLVRRKAKLVRPEDVAIGRLISQGLSGVPPHLPQDPEVADLALRRMTATGRCHWRSSASPPLAQGPPRRGRIDWHLLPDGRQALAIAADEGIHVLRCAAPWYVDPQSRQAGPLDLGLPPETLRALLRAPLLDKYQAVAVRDVLVRALPDLPTPATDLVEETRTEPPAPCLTLISRPYAGYLYGYGSQWGGAAIIDLALLTYDYAGIVIDPDAAPPELRRAEGQRVLVHRRDRKAERAALRRLADLGLDRSYHAYATGAPPERIVLAFRPGPDVEAAWAGFVHHDLPALRAEGWKIEIAPDFRHRIVEASGDWEARVEEAGGWWFSLDLGIEVEGQRIALLPVLTSLLQRLREPTAAALDSLAVGGTLYAPLPDGRRLALPLERVRPLLATLIELYDAKALSADGRLEISLAQAAGLAEIEAATRLRWLGGERLRELARRLAGFTGIAPVAPPAGLCAVLRPYQQDGLAWLQFLRDYELGGILADDMGLGKTIQTLAHVLTEKAAGRLDRPCLVVCPTSVLPNWLAEAARFAPELRVLPLHGRERAARFPELDAADLAVTTYALLPRDADMLLEREWHLAVLDEAQAIKNPSAKATQLVCRLKARHRLCLTGTPVENHLGEVWSQFAFLLPGLLGDSRRFARTFRNPIEKRGDAERRALLSARLRPFLLRRTKAQVAAELPPKTEIVRRVGLASDQRNLYETLRLAMHDKVRDAVARKGLARSHIEILDALLKLRQACCDPRLVKLTAAKKVRSSAKLELLIGMLPELVEEGRRILLFSQFTSMLDLIKPELAKRSVAFVELRGDTADRETPVLRFQSGEVPLFLVSLKAGGTGLNLTAADTVIHYDPWWNPAAENQASDRAHRKAPPRPIATAPAYRAFESRRGHHAA